MTEEKPMTREQFVAEMHAAVYHESFSRSAAFVGLNETIRASDKIFFEVRPMTLRHYEQLKITGSPFLPPFETPKPTDIGAFLWMLSPDYDPKNTTARAALLKRCRCFVPPDKPWLKTKRNSAIYEAEFSRRLLLAAQMTEAIRAFVREAFLDFPGSKSVAVRGPEYFSDACALCAGISREYHCDLLHVMELPLKCIGQLLKERKWHHEDNPILGNPSDAIKDRWLKQLNKGLNRN